MAGASLAISVTRTSRPLLQEDVKEIVSIQFQHVKDMMRKNGIDLEITPEAVDALASLSYEPQFE